MTNFPAQKQLWLIPAIWWLANVAFLFWLSANAGFDTPVSAIDSMVSNIILAALCTGAAFSVRYYRPRPEQALYLLLGIIVLAVLWNWLSSQILLEVLKEEPRYNDFLETTTYIRLLTGTFMVSLFVMIGWLSFYMNEQLEEKNRHEEIARMSREAELNNLRQQLQPHFLFNTLNSISALSVTTPEMARKMIQQLSDFLRGTLKKEDQLNSTLKEEIDHLNLYLEIEKIRFGNRLDAVFKIDEDVKKIILPSLLLQPLVENAIKFGLYDTLDEVTVEIAASKEDHYLKITIINPYDSQTSKKAPGTGFGLKSVNRRLYLIFGRNDLLETKDENGKFIATLKIPNAG